MTLTDDYHAVWETDVTPEDFVTCLMRDVVDQNAAAYREMFASSRESEAVDPYGREAHTFFESLSAQQQGIFFRIIRQVSVDTVSNVLGVLDGVNMVEGGDDGFTVVYGHDQILNGDLQSLFLVEDEKRQ